MTVKEKRATSELPGMALTEGYIVVWWKQGASQPTGTYGPFAGRETAEHVCQNVAMREDSRAAQVRVVTASASVSNAKPEGSVQ